MQVFPAWECHCLFPLLILFCVCFTMLQLFQDDTFLPTSFLSTAEVQVGSQLSGLAVKQSRYSHTCEQCMGLHKLCSLKCAGVDLLWVNLMVAGEIWGKAAHSVALVFLGAVAIFKPWNKWLTSALSSSQAWFKVSFWPGYTERNLLLGKVKKIKQLEITVLTSYPESL